MASASVLLAVMAAAGYAVGNVLDKLLMTGHVERPTVKAVASAVLSPVIAGPLLLFGFVARPAPLPLMALLGAGALLFVSTVVFMRAMRTGEVSRLSLIIQTSPLFALGFSIILLGTVLATQQLLGIGVLMVAAFLAALDHPAERLPRFQINAPVVYTLGSTAMFAFGAVLVRFALQSTTVWTAVYWQYTGMFLAGVPFLLAGPVRHELRRIVVDQRRAAGLLVATSAAYVAAQIAFVGALAEAPAAVVTAIVTISPLFVLGFVVLLRRFGVDRFEEELTRLEAGVKGAAVVLFVAGVYLVK